MICIIQTYDLEKELKDKVDNPEEQVVLISHGDCMEYAEYLKKLVMSEVKVRNVIINCAGPIIGTHMGPEIICIAFIGRPRKA